MCKGGGNSHKGRWTPGSPGHPDHQRKVEELGKKAQSEAKKGEQVLRESAIRGHNSKRIPDQQIVGADGRTRKAYEAERLPNSQRHKDRIKEYDDLGIENETAPL